jgi:ABC-type multidrug transport system fused ATPase/permease subunit
VRLLITITVCNFLLPNTDTSFSSRFSKDIETIDGSLTGSLRQVLVSTASLIGAIILVTGILPWFVVPAAFISYAFYVLSVRYLNVSRDLRRIEATARSPIFSGFGEVLDGITTVRAFSAEKMFKEKLFAQVDHSQAAFYQYVVSWALIFPS